MITDLLEEYRLAFEDNIQCSKAEVLAKEAKTKARYRLQSAEEALRQKKEELLEEIERR